MAEKIIDKQPLKNTALREKLQNLPLSVPKVSQAPQQPQARTAEQSSQTLTISKYAALFKKGMPRSRLKELEKAIGDLENAVWAEAIKPNSKPHAATDYETVTALLAAVRKELRRPEIVRPTKRPKKGIKP
jgi:hypothetical protein